MPRSGSDSTKIKRNDLILTAAILLISGVLWLLISLSGKTGGRISIRVDGQLYGTYLLNEDREIVIGPHTADDGAVTGSTETRRTDTNKTMSAWRNVLKIHAGQVSMIEADCPDLICVHHKPISKQGESIVCLPHKVIVEVTGEKAAQKDEEYARSTTQAEDYDLLTR